MFRKKYFNKNISGKFIGLLVLICTIAGICKAQKRIIAFNDAALAYEGRISYKADAANLSWPGTSVTINFKGKSVAAILKDSDTANYYQVIVDGKEGFKIHTDTAKLSYILASGLKKGNHTVQLFKRTEWDKGSTLFYGFEIFRKTKVLPASEAKKRKIEFYGNSITCGYAMEDSSGNDSYHGYFENNYRTYAAITARHFGARYTCISRSGIGIMVSWFPLIMPEMYDRCDPTDSGSKWDFSTYTPDVVVINLLQNDSWLINMPRHEQFKYRFGTKAPDELFIISAYKNFVASIRKKYPSADIICALGNMDATREGFPWPGYIKQAVAQLHDPKIYTHFFGYKQTNGHPNTVEQQIMANSLIDFIQHTINW